LTSRPGKSRLTFNNIIQVNTQLGLEHPRELKGTEAVKQYPNNKEIHGLAKTHPTPSPSALKETKQTNPLEHTISQKGNPWLG
jgi:hypothetical protein